VKLTDSRIITAPRSVVWSALMSVDVLKACVPGCREMQGTAEEGFEATVVQKVGPVKATFRGLVTLSNMFEPESLTLSGEGKGGPAGFAKGGADLKLEETPEGTKLTYEVEANVGGKLAQLGSRVIDGFAKKMADQFFERFKTEVEESVDDPESESGASAPDRQAMSEEATRNGGQAKKSWFAWLKNLFGR